MKLFGIPVKIHPSFFVMSVLLGSSRGFEPAAIIEWMAVVAVSVMIHEFGHALTCRIFGLKPEIMLHSMGGVTSWKSAGALSPWKTMAISLAGPAAGFVVGVIVLIVGVVVRMNGPLEGLTALIIGDLLWVNIGWGLFNLLPVLPLDGGNFTRSLVQLFTSKAHVAEIATRVTSIVVASLLMLGAISIRWTWVILLAAMFLYQNGVQLIQLIQANRDRSLNELLRRGQAAAGRNEGEEAIRIADELLRTARSRSMKCSALKLKANGLIINDDLQGARVALNELRALSDQDDNLEAILLLRSGNNENAELLLTKLFTERRDAWSGYNLVEALTALGKFDRALEIVRQSELAQFGYQLALTIESSAFKAGEYAAAVNAGEFAFSLKRDPSVAYNIACAMANAQRIDEGIQWLRTALEAGFADMQLLATDPDLSGLRQHPEFAELMTANAAR